MPAMNHATLGYWCGLHLIHSDKKIILILHSIPLCQQFGRKLFQSYPTNEKDTEIHPTRTSGVIYYRLYIPPTLLDLNTNKKLSDIRLSEDKI